MAGKLRAAESVSDSISPRAYLTQQAQRQKNAERQRRREEEEKRAEEKRKKAEAECQELLAERRKKLAEDAKLREDLARERVAEAEERKKMAAENKAKLKDQQAEERREKIRKRKEERLAKQAAEVMANLADSGRGAAGEQQPGGSASTSSSAAAAAAPGQSALLPGGGPGHSQRGGAAAAARHRKDSDDDFLSVPLGFGADRIYEQTVLEMTSHLPSSGGGAAPTEPKFHPPSRLAGAGAATSGSSEDAEIQRLIRGDSSEEGTQCKLGDCLCWELCVGLACDLCARRALLGRGSWLFGRALNAAAGLARALPLLVCGARSRVGVASSRKSNCSADRASLFCALALTETRAGRIAE